MLQPMSVESSKQSGESTIFGNFVNFAQTEKGISNQAPSNEVSRTNCILYSGAWAHVKGKLSEFS
jgi:hypothetical protein